MDFRKKKRWFFLIVGLSLLISCNGQALPREKRNGSTPEDEMKRPIYLYKVLSMDDWVKSCETVHLSSMDTDFIHFSTEDQLDKIIEKYWTGVSEYVVLKIETAKLSGNLVLEANPGGTTQYYHLYNGAIPLNAISELKVHKK